MYFDFEELAIQEETLMDAILDLKNFSNKEKTALCPKGCGTPLVKQKFIEV